MPNDNSPDASKTTLCLKGRRPDSVAYQTQLGRMYNGKSEDILKRPEIQRLKGSVDLIFTSPPFPLNRKKKYGNLNGEAYIDWLTSIGGILKELLSETGSIVMEVGNSWESGSPTMSTLATRALLSFLDDNDLKLCQEFVWNNPAKLPSPAQWVNIERCRVKDSFTKIWWMSPSERPKANNRNVLVPYSSSMKKLLKTGRYNSGLRPSEHNIGEKSFLQDNGGAIPGSVLTYSNTGNQEEYNSYCKERGLPPHPARMPLDLPEFFISFLTDPEDLVIDPFGGSNTTGYVAEKLGRKWISVEPNIDYIKGSAGRFPGLVTQYRPDIE